jgi:Coenzyme PQQ synthesis protein D (PqqD)
LIEPTRDILLAKFEFQIVSSMSAYVPRPKDKVNAKAQRPLVRTKQTICEEVSGELVVYDSLQKKAHHLNSTLTWIWHRCDGDTPMEALAAAFEQEFNVTNGIHVLSTGLEQLNANGLLENQIDIDEVMAAEKNAVSRRAVVVGGSVLMPLIVSILAPTPAAAQSPNPRGDKGKDKEKKDKEKKDK